MSARSGAATTFCLAGLVCAGGCTPTVARDPVPDTMQFDLQSKPPRAPQPTSLIVNPQTGKLDFSIAGTPVITALTDCSTPPAGLSAAECAFDQALQTLDGFPTVIPAQTPASANLDSTTLTAGTNVVVVEAKSGTVTTDVTVGFDSVGRNVTLRPARSWKVGGSYWVGVRGYADGVRAASGGKVVGSPTMAMLKKDTPLTCGATSPATIDPKCPALLLLLQSFAADPSLGAIEAATMAAQSVFQLEAIRLGYAAGWQVMASVGGLPKEQTAVLWNFPIHTSSVAELDPTAQLVPQITAADEMRVAVQGPVNAATVTPYVFMQKYGSVIVMDLTTAAAGNLPGAFPAVDATFADGQIVIKGHAPFVAGNQYGLFFTDKLHDDKDAALVPSPVSILLRLRGALTTADGHSTITTVTDSDAAMLESGRAQLSTLFDKIEGLVGVTREHFVYCFAFPFPVTL